MTRAVMKITPERTSAIVPGSANLYATKIYVLTFSESTTTFKRWFLPYC